MLEPVCPAPAAMTPSKGTTTTTRGEGKGSTWLWDISTHFEPSTVKEAGQPGRWRFSVGPDPGLELTSVFRATLPAKREQQPFLQIERLPLSIFSDWARTARPSCLEKKRQTQNPGGKTRGMPANRIRKRTKIVNFFLSKQMNPVSNGTQHLF